METGMSLLYKETETYFAQAPGMMEDLCLEELSALGARNPRKAFRGVYFEAAPETLYRINYCSRLASRVLAPLSSFQCDSPDDILRNAAKIQWDSFFGLEKTFAITASVSKSRITNSLYAAQCLKDGIADYFRSKFGKRPDVNVSAPDIRFNLFIEEQKAVLSLDTSGESLHKRGYRLQKGEAPMQETLAAAIVKISGWDGLNPLWDCMCGSGTILCEALMNYCGIPSQYLKKRFGFESLPDFNPSSWTEVRSASDSAIREIQTGLISGSDKSQIVVNYARENLGRLPFGEKVTLRCQPFEHVKSFEDGTLITNPPYGIRIGEKREAEALFEKLGDFLKKKCRGTNAFIFTGDRSLQKNIGLKISKKIPLVNGQLEGTLFRIESYEGSRKKKYLKDKKFDTPRGDEQNGGANSHGEEQFT